MLSTFSFLPLTKIKSMKRKRKLTKVQKKLERKRKKKKFGENSNRHFIIHSQFLPTFTFYTIKTFQRKKKNS